jgi:hypothetical protein
MGDDCSHIRRLPGAAAPARNGVSQKLSQYYCGRPALLIARIACERRLTHILGGDKLDRASINWRFAVNVVDHSQFKASKWTGRRFDTFYIFKIIDANVMSKSVQDVCCVRSPAQ